MAYNEYIIVLPENETISTHLFYWEFLFEDVKTAFRLAETVASAVSSTWAVSHVFLSILQVCHLSVRMCAPHLQYPSLAVVCCPARHSSPRVRHRLPSFQLHSNTQWATI